MQTEYYRICPIKRSELRGSDRKRRKIGLDKAALTWYYIQALEVQPKYRGVEQLVARRAHNPEVVGSSPASATIKSTENNLFSVLFLYF